ncbi:hypothetical protein HNR31_003135 [Anoxybacillus caldiproteolyticus]|uniref:Uncharacterized protein n=1 Tax=Thermaerobacillus caldiproteolyticus TaxID=247480 RepID=A0A7W0C057_9BACL|nr:hypothetical protein [Anoxybacillus caldiproteolyticus]
MDSLKVGLMFSLLLILGLPKSLMILLGVGEWDFLGSSTFYTQSKTFYSGGEDLLNQKKTSLLTIQ